MTKAHMVPLEGYRALSAEDMERRATGFADEVARRRTIRQFSSRSVPRHILEECIRAAGTAPSGANRQPWHFVVVEDPDIKREIREAAEREEHEFYTTRAPPEWLEALEPLGTDEQKPFLETAPFLIVIFGERYGVTPEGHQFQHYYVTESVGIATGILITALHYAGLATLTHTPSPMKFLNEILLRPAHERPFLILVVGYPSSDAMVPDIQRKPLGEIVTFR